MTSKRSMSFSLSSRAVSMPVVVEENPLENLKVLYGTGAPKLNDETGETERVGGIKYTIKDGIIYDAKQLLVDVREMVREAKAELATDEQDN